MKELTSYNRVAGYLNKIFDLLNAAYFENALSRPTITIQSTPKAYGHFSLREDTWLSKNGATHEINIGAGTLSRPISLAWTATSRCLKCRFQNRQGRGKPLLPVSQLNIYDTVISTTENQQMQRCHNIEP